MRGFSVIAFVVVLGAGAIASQDALGDVRQFQAKRFAAMIHRDIDGVAALLGEDLTYTHSSGDTETKARFLETLRSGRIVYEQIEPADVAVRMYGQTAVVTGRSTMHVRIGGQPQTFQIRFVEVDVSTGGRWQMVAWQATRLVSPSGTK
jgi:ketosteroid isomerase-like protein